MRARDIKVGMTLEIKPFTEKEFWAAEEKYKTDLCYTEELQELIGNYVTVISVNGSEIKVEDEAENYWYLPACFFKPGFDSKPKDIMSTMKINWLIVREENCLLKMSSAFEFHGSVVEVQKQAEDTSKVDGGKWVWFERRGSVTVGKTVFGD